MNNKIKMIMNYTKQKGGCTFTKELEILEKLKGYTISIAKFEYKTELEKTNEIINNIQNKIEILKNTLKSKNFVIGTWINNGILYIDINKIELNKTRALELAKIQNQLAIFDNVNKTEIFLKKNSIYILYQYIEEKNDIVYINEFTEKREISKFLGVRDFEYLKKFIYKDFINDIQKYFTKQNTKYILIEE